jgi:hypothetical protein
MVFGTGGDAILDQFGGPCYASCGSTIRVGAAKCRLHNMSSMPFIASRLIG